MVVSCDTNDRNFIHYEDSNRFSPSCIGPKSASVKKNEIPVGVVIYDPKKMTLISKAHNKELSSKDPTSHAEILCIRKACKKLNQKRLDGLIMITYLEPCNMCKEVIKSARLKEVRFIFRNRNPSRKTIKKIFYQKLETNEDNLVKIFFKKKRIKN